MTKLFCFETLIMEPEAIAGKKYQILDENEKEIAIKNEHDEVHYFSKDPSDESYFGNWFIKEDEVMKK